MKIYHKKNFAEGLFMLVLGLLNLSTGISQSSITIKDGIVCAALFLFGGTLLLRSLSPSANRQDKIEAMDERDQLIDVQAKSHALEYVITATQILTVLCLLKGNPAWRGSLSLLFFGIAFMLFYKYQQYTAKPYRQVGIVFLAIGAALLVWFAVAG